MRPLSLSGLLLLLTVPVSGRAGTVPDLVRVCYGMAPGSQTDCEVTEDIAAQPRSERIGQRRAVITSHFIAFDEVEQNATNGALDLQCLRRIPLSAFISTEQRDLPVIVTVRDTNESAVTKWSIKVSADELGAADAIIIPEGNYEAAFSAAHCRDTKIALDARSPRPKRATVVIRRAPTITGRVVTWSGIPASDASIQFLPGKHVCTTDATGAFVFEADDEWPSMIRFTYPGAGTKVVLVSPSERDVRLGEIHLQTAVALRLDIGSPEVVRAVAVSVFRDGDGPPVEIATRSVTLPATEPPVLTGLEPGVYRLVIRGERPFQQYSRLVRLADSETSEKVVITESHLTVIVTSGERRERGASVTLKSIAGKWRGSLTVDDNGSAIEPLWQTGEFSFAVLAKGAVTPVLGHGSLADDESLQWTLRLPDGRIEGTVLNDSGAAISNATVALTTEDGDMQTSIRATSDSNGRFSFDHVRYGAQTLSASAEGFLPAVPELFALSQTVTEHSAELRLKKGTSVRVSVVDRRGVPYPKAIVFESVDNELVNTLETGSSGEVDVNVPEKAGSIVLVAVPESGSFAVMRIGAAARDAGVARMNVPEGTGSLEIKSETTDHVPVRDVHFLVRYDGEILPFEVLMRLAQWHILEFRTDVRGVGTVSSLPPGMYELWPYARMADVSTLTSGMDVPAPLRVALGDGLTSATMTFRKKSR